MPIGATEKMLHWATKIHTRLFTLLISSAFKELGARSRLDPPFRFSGLNRVSVGEGVMINRDCWFQTIPDGGRRNETKLVIGSHACIGMGAHISAAKQVLIEEYVLLARNVHIADHAHAFENLDVPIMEQGINRIAPVAIGKHTWLGQNVVVLPGVTIGKHCVIGANSVVNSSIPDYSVAAGSPARVIRHFNPQTCIWERTTPDNSH